MNKRITLRDIAGYCPEDAIWKMVADLGQNIKNNHNCPSSPDGVIVDDLSFLIDETVTIQEEFLAPEITDGTTQGIKQEIWTLGALIYYASSGRILFGGHGGTYQKSHPNVLLPALRKDHQPLTALMQQCLKNEPEDRIDINRLVTEAHKGLENCLKMTRGHKEIAKETSAAIFKNQKENWPEEMKESI